MEELQEREPSALTNEIVYESRDDTDSYQDDMSFECQEEGWNEFPLMRADSFESGARAEQEDYYVTVENQKERMMYLSKEVQSKENQIQQLYQTLSEERENTMKLKHQLEDREKKLNLLEDELEGMLVSIKDYEDDLEVKNAELSSLRQNVKDLKERNGYFEELFVCMEEKWEQERELMAKKQQMVEKELLSYKQKSEEQVSIEVLKPSDSRLFNTPATNHATREIEDRDQLWREEREELVHEVNRLVQRNKELEEELAAAKETHKLVMDEKNESMDKMRTQWEDAVGNNELLTMEMNKLRSNFEAQEFQCSTFLSEEDEGSDELSQAFVQAISSLREKVERHGQNMVAMATQNQKLKKLLQSEQAQNTELNTKLAKVWEQYDEACMQLMATETEQTQLKATLSSKILSDEFQLASDGLLHQLLNKSFQDLPDLFDNDDYLLTHYTHVDHDEPENSKRSLLSPSKSIIPKVLRAAVNGLQGLFLSILGIKRQRNDGIGTEQEINVEDAGIYEDATLIPNAKELTILAGLSLVAILSILTGSQELVLLPIIIPASITTYASLLLLRKSKYGSEQSLDAEQVSKDPFIASVMSEDNDLRMLNNENFGIQGDMGTKNNDDFSISCCNVNERVKELNVEKKLEEIRKRKSSFLNKLTSHFNSALISDLGDLEDAKDQNLTSTKTGKENRLSLSMKLIGCVPIAYFCFFSMFPLAVLLSFYLHVFHQFWTGWGLVVYYVILLSLFALIIKERLGSSSLQDSLRKLTWEKGSLARQAIECHFEVQEFSVLLNKERELLAFQRREIVALEKRLLSENESIDSIGEVESHLTEKVNEKNENENKSCLPVNVNTGSEEVKTALHCDVEQGGEGMVRSQDGHDTNYCREERRKTLAGNTTVVHYILFISAASLPSLSAVYMTAHYLSMTAPILLLFALLLCIPGMMSRTGKDSSVWNFVNRHLNYELRSNYFENNKIRIVKVLVGTLILILSILTSLTIFWGSTLSQIVTGIFQVTLSLMVLFLTEKLMRERRIATKLKLLVSSLVIRNEKEITYATLMKEEREKLQHQIGILDSQLKELRKQHASCVQVVKPMEEKDNIIYRTKMAVLKKELENTVKERDELVITNLDLFESVRLARRELADAEIKLLQSSRRRSSDPLPFFAKTQQESVYSDNVDSGSRVQTLDKAKEIQPYYPRQDHEKRFQASNHSGLAVENKELSNQLQALKESLKARNLEVEMLSKEISKQKEEIEGWKIQRDMVHRALEAYKQKEIQSKVMEEENHKLQSELAVSSAMKSTLERERDQGRNQVKELTTKLENLQQELQKFQNLHEQMESVREQNNSFLLEIENLLQEGKEVKEELWIKEVQLSRLAMVQEEKEDIKKRLQRTNNQEKDQEQNENEEDERSVELEDLEKYRFKPSFDIDRFKEMKNNAENISDENSKAPTGDDFVSYVDRSTPNEPLIILALVKDREETTETESSDLFEVTPCSDQYEVFDWSEDICELVKTETSVPSILANSDKNCNQESSNVSWESVDSTEAENGLEIEKIHFEPQLAVTDVPVIELGAQTSAKGDLDGSHVIQNGQHDDVGCQLQHNFAINNESPLNNLAAELAEADNLTGKEQSISFSPGLLNPRCSKLGKNWHLPRFVEVEELRLDQLRKITNNLDETEKNVVSITKSGEAEGDGGCQLYGTCRKCSDLPILARALFNFCAQLSIPKETQKLSEDTTCQYLTVMVEKASEKVADEKTQLVDKIENIQKVKEDVENALEKVKKELKEEKLFREKLINDFEEEYVGLEAAMSKECKRIKEKLQSERTIRGDMVTDYEKEIEARKHEHENEAKDLKDSLRQEIFQREEAQRRSQRLFRQVHTLESELETIRKQRAEEVHRYFVDLQELLIEDQLVQDDCVREVLKENLLQYDMLKTVLEAEFAARVKSTQDKMQDCQTQLEAKTLLLEEKEADLGELSQEKQLLAGQNGVLLQKILQLEEEIRINMDVSSGYDEESETSSEVGNQGILDNLGSNEDNSSWQNPAKNALISVMRSSPGHGHPSDVLEKRPLPCSTDDREQSWFKIDFGSKMVVLPRAYSLRHGWVSSEGCMRSWTLEGSIDGERWIEIRKHENENTLNSRYKKVFWTLSGVYKPFRYLRVRQTSQNSSGTHELYLSGFEVYGSLIRATP